MTSTLPATRTATPNSAPSPASPPVLRRRSRRESVVDADARVAAPPSFLPGGAAICEGQVFHRRARPVEHGFARRVSYVWIDPDDPESLCDGHPFWSARLPAPARFRRRDYGLEPAGSLSDAARRDLADVLGRHPAGPVRMLTQVRRWGWLFNPITVYVVWDSHRDPSGPVGAVLEVSNTPWKERIRYPIALTFDSTSDDGWWRARTAKAMHVSPFLDEDHDYDVRIRRHEGELQLDVDVVPRGPSGRAAEPVLLTGVRLVPSPPTRRTLGAALRDPSTLRVSFGIHTEAMRLWWKRVPFVPHPSKREVGGSRRRRTVASEMTMSETAPSDAATSGTAGDPTPSDAATSGAAGELVTSGRTSTDRLMARADRGAATRRGVITPVAGMVAKSMLRLARHERLTVDHAGGTPTYGDVTGDVEIDAAVTLHDERALAALAREGSIGLGRGYVEGWWTSDDPVAVVQFAIRNIHGLDRLRNRVRRGVGWISDPVRRALPHDTRNRNRDDIGAHYDIGNDFFQLFLDETMTYSSAVFPTPDASLADASRHKYDLLLDKLGVESGDHLLEIGTGWGGMALRAAERGVRVTTTTISAEQLAGARRRIAAAGMSDRVELLDADWRDLDGSFDHVVSIEMIEAVDWRDYDDYFATIERCLRPGGRAAIQAICLPDDRWERAKSTEDFIRRFVFPNGFLPSVAAIRDSVGTATDLSVVEVDDITPHYAETLLRWRANFDARIDEVAELGLDERFQRLWRFYLAYCEAGFRERHIHTVQLAIA